jgi:hypothetical protein
MKRVLIVSPSFPPVSTADLHRVRASLPHFASFGWSPHVLAVDPATHGGLLEPDLLTTVPADIPVTRTAALPETLTRLIGIGNPGLRAIAHLYAAGNRLLARESFDLVYFSTTMFPVMALGRLWKARHGVPYVIDLQDPWKTEYHGAGRASGFKASAARLMHAMLEPFAMKGVDGIVSVSRAYIDTLRRRYPWLSDETCAVIPFGVSPEDFTAARKLDWHNPFFDAGDGQINAVSVGRGGRDLRRAADLLFTALRLIRDRGMRVPPLRLWFVGTDYAASGGERTIAPAAELAGLGAIVNESPRRLPYLEALRLLEDARLTVILGSDDASYSPSKVYPYLMVGKPFVAVLHAECPVASLLDAAGTGLVARFAPGEDVTLAASRLADGVSHLLAALPERAPVDPQLLERVTARGLTKRQCVFFDLVVRRLTTEAVPCAS